MAYTKTNWENGVTPANATNMNHVEQGIYNNSLKADQVGDLATLDTTVKTDLVSAINELVAETGTSGIWNYIKYSNGFAICYGIYTWDFTEWTSWGSVYTSGTYQSTSYPFTFTSTPSVTISAVNTGSNDIIGIGQPGGAEISTTTTPGFRFIRPANGSSVTGAKVSIIAIGKWK